MFLPLQDLVLGDGNGMGRSAAGETWSSARSGWMVSGQGDPGWGGVPGKARPLAQIRPHRSLREPKSELCSEDWSALLSSAARITVAQSKSECVDDEAA